MICDFQVYVDHFSNSKEEMSRVKMGLAGGLASLTAGSIGAYLGIDRDSDTINKVLSLDSQPSSKRGGRCKVRISLTQGQESTKSYSDFYKENGDKGTIAKSCLQWLSKRFANEDHKNVVMKLKQGSDGTYIYEGGVITDL